MTKITKTLLRGACLATLAGLGLVLTPAPAQAAFIVFTVDEGAVPGTPANSFQADLLNGGYAALLTLVGDGNPFDGSGVGTWTETASAVFSQYFLGPNVPPTQYIADSEPNGYSILGTLNAAGTYQESTCGPFSCIFFTFTQQTGTLGIDADQNGVAESPLLSANGVDVGTFGSITFSGGPSGGTGSFNSNFLNNTLAGGIAPSYWPTLSNIQFTTTINGDLSQVNVPNLQGDVSVQFTEKQVPEPAALGLLGLGLIASVVSRRRATKA